MRPRYDENGNIKSYHNMLFDNIPDDYKMQKVLTGDKFADWSAQYLYSGIVGDRDGNIVSHYLVPCAFACKHSIELKLKECQIEKGFEKLKGHSVLEVWNALDERDIPHSKEITAFLGEVEKIDKNEMALRYGIGKKLEPLQEKFKFDIDSLITNTMFLFNILDEYVIHKYRFKH